MYKLRIEEWEENNGRPHDKEEKFHKFENDFKIPQDIWDKLYKLVNILSVTVL